MARQVYWLFALFFVPLSVFGFSVSSNQKQAPSVKKGSENPSMTTNSYSQDQLVAALAQFIGDDDGSHIFGYGDPNHKLSTLQTITGSVILDYGDRETTTMEELLSRASQLETEYGPRVNLQTIIQNQQPCMALAAEFKRASPSKGDIAVHLDAGQQAVSYAVAGANIISILTEPRWFKGSLDDLKQVRIATNKQRPAILRKDFVVSEYMIAEAAAYGADTILLIVAILGKQKLKELIDYARSLNMEPLVEVHADEELDVAIECGARVIGVNNRNLHTFQVDMGTSERVAERMVNEFQLNIEADYSICALSGMSTALDVDRYRQAKLQMVLIGESLMRATDPQASIKALCLDPADLAKQSNAGGAYIAGTKLIKVCGISNGRDALVACQAGANLIGVIFAEKSKRKVSVEQALDVTKAVRAFGERSDKLKLDTQSDLSPLAHLSQASAKLFQAVAQRPAVVGVFQNQDASFINDMIEQCGLDIVQLHGSEGMKAANPSNFNGTPVLRVVDIAVDKETGKASSDCVETILDAITSDPTAILLDTSIKGDKTGGGTGVSFDWSIAERLQNAGLPVMVAGGLTADTVSECVTATLPFGVDVAGGVEETPRQKDHEKTIAFVKNARAAAAQASQGF